MTIRVALHHRTTLQVRPAGRPVAARDPAAAGAALPHADRELLAARRAREALRQLAAGPVRQLHRALRLPGAGARSSTITVDLVADMTVINPFDFFVEQYAEQFPFDYPPQLAAELAPYLEPETPGPLLDRLARGVRDAHGPSPVGNMVDFLVDAQPTHLPGDVTYLVRMEPGIQSPEQTLELGGGLVPRLRVAAGADPPPPRARGALRLRLSRSSSSPTSKPLDGPRGPTADFTDLHAWAEVYMPGRGLDRARSDVRPARRRGPHPARLHRVAVERRAGDRLHRRLPKSSSRFEMKVDAHPRGSARHQAVHRRAMGGDRRARARESTRELARARTCG